MLKNINNYLWSLNSILDFVINIKIFRHNIICCYRTFQYINTINIGFKALNTFGVLVNSIECDIRNTGKIAITLRDDDELLDVQLADSDDDVLIASSIAVKLLEAFLCIHFINLYL